MKQQPLWFLLCISLIVVCSLLTGNTQTEAANATATQANIALNWTELGPNNLGGRTRQLLIHPTNPDVMYALAQNGGIWKTTNGGNLWQPLTDFFVSLAISTLTFDPANPEILFAGTGDMFSSQYSARGVGIFKSVNGGVTWTLLPGTSVSDFQFINDLVISPRSSQRIYAATNTGVWRSLNGGTTWTLVLDGRAQGGAQDLVIRTDQTTDFIYAEIGYGRDIFRRAPEAYGVYKNTDASGAGNWQRLNMYPNPNNGLARLALAPSNQNIAYLLLTPQEFGIGFVILKTTDSGENWLDIGLRSSAGWQLSLRSNWLAANWRLCNLTKASTENAQPALQTASLAVDPTNPQRIWLGGIDLFRSDDAGGDWNLASASWVNGRQFAGSKHSAIVFHPGYNGSSNKTLYTVNSNGIYRTNDALASIANPCKAETGAANWQPLNNGYNATAFLSGAVSADGKNYLGGTLGSGLLRGSEATGKTGWVKSLSGDVGGVIIDPRNAKTIYASVPSQNNSINSTLPYPRYGIKKSTDGGLNFGLAQIGIIETPGPDYFLPPLAVDPSNSQRLYTGQQGLMRSDNGAASWILAGALGDARVNTGLSAITVSPTDSKTVLLGTGLGNILSYTLNDEPRPSTELPAVKPRDGYLSSLAFDPLQSNIAYATYATFGGTHVWKSLDAGKTWASLDGTGTNALPDIPVNCLAIDPTNTARIFIGTDTSVFSTVDAGLNWTRDTGLPMVPVAALVLNISNNNLNLFAFTNGRGAWRATVGSVGNVGCDFLLAASGQNFSETGGTGTVTFTAGSSSCVWAAQSNAAWITLTSAVNGSGSASVRFTVAPNATFTSRSGTIAIAGRSYLVQQAAFVDKTAPTLSILSPTASQPNGVITTDAATIILSGTASDNVGVKFLFATVDGLNTSTEAFQVRGTTTWTSGAIPLHAGFNRVGITAQDTSNNGTTSIINVFKRQEAALTPTPVNTPNGISQMAFDAAGNLYFSDYLGVSKQVADGTITRFAGSASSGFAGDGGNALQARFSVPEGLAFDRNGNLYIADSLNHRIRKITPAGIISTVAGSSTTDNLGGFGGDGGQATSAMLNRPLAVALDNSGNLFIADYANARVRKVTSDGVISTFAGNGGPVNSGEGGPAAQAGIGSPTDLAFDNAGNLYVSDAQSGRIRKITPQGIITTIAGTTPGYAGDGGPAAQAKLNWPRALTFDGAGNLYFIDLNNQAIRAIGTNGNIRTVIRNITVTDLILAPTGKLWVSDISRVYRLTPLPTSDSQAPTLSITNPTTNNTYTTAFPYVAISGTALDNNFVAHITVNNDRASSTAYLSLLSNGGNPLPINTAEYRFGITSTDFSIVNWNVLVSLKLGANRLSISAFDYVGNVTTKQLTVTYAPLSTFETYAGQPNQPGFGGDGALASNATLNSPRNLAFDPAGNLYFSDTSNHRIRKITPAGIISTIAGNGSVGFSGDGGPATAAELNEPLGLVLDKAGNLYFSDSQNHRIRMIQPNGNISTLAGTGEPGFGGDSGLAREALLNQPLDLVIDSLGNLFFIDGQNRRIRKITTNGLITSIAAPYYGISTPPPSLLSVTFPIALAIDRENNLYVADREKSTIEKISPNGLLAPIAGNESGSFDEGISALQARLDQPTALAVDDTGTLYVSSQGRRLSRILPDGKIFNVVSLGQISNPAGLTIHPVTGKLFAALNGEHQISFLSERSFLAATAVSAADYSNRGLPAASIATVFGSNLATATAVANTIPLPYTLAGTTVGVANRFSGEIPAQLLFVSPNQINFIVPPNSLNNTLITGMGSVFITNSNVETRLAPVQITRLAPALFSANATGQGVAAAVALRVLANGEQRYESISTFDAAQQKYIPLPLDVSNPNEKVYLVLFGTGIRALEALRVINVNIANVSTPVLYAGAQGSFAGLDQINVQLPTTLAKRGEVDIVVKVEGISANTLRMNFK